MPNKLSDLKPAPYNPRKISKEQLEALGKSMREFGDLSGIVVNVATGNIVGGHQRIKHLDPTWAINAEKIKDKTGSIRIGYVEAPWGRIAYRKVSWPIAKEKVANLAANKHGGEFDVDAVKMLLAEIDDGSFDMDLTGFLADERNALSDLKMGEMDADETSAIPKKSIAQIGDIWQLGDHRVICGNSTKPETLSKLLEKESADLLFSDPPYGVNYGAKNRMLNSFQPSGRNLADIENDNISRDDLQKMLHTAFSNAREAMSDTASFYVTAPQGGELGLMMMMMMMMNAGLPTRHVLIWVKNSPTFSMGRLDYDYQHEPILYGWKKKHKFIGGGEHKQSIWLIDKPRESKEHPTMKPVALMVNAILNSTEVGDIVLDIFGGSGSTLIAAEQTKRRCRMIEIEPKYVDVIVTRWEKFTGQKARLQKS